MAGVVGGVVGGVIGWFVGGPTGAQWGYAIGASIGSSFEVTKMPRIGEFAQVTAGEGGPRPRVYGRVRPLGGQTVWAGRPREIRKRERSKGGAPVESSEIRRSYAIGFCEGPITRFLRIWRNNELVYDARPNPTIPWMESQKWAEKVRFYTGGFDQMPCPVLQAELGGDAPAMRGTAYFSVEDDELTQSGGAVPMYAAEVQRGAAKSYTTPPYPAYVEDSIGIRSEARDGFVWLPPLDEIGISSHALNGVHRPLIQSYAVEPEEVGIVSHALDGTHRPLIAPYATEPEEIEISSVALDGTHRVVIIPYLNYEPEEVEVTSHALDGTHGPA